MSSFYPDFELVSGIEVVDSTGNLLIIGEKYEMYTPIAECSEQGIGLIFDDAEGHSFTYAGVIHMGGNPYIASPDIGYEPDATPLGITDELKQCLYGAGMAHPLCPTYIAAKFVRPVTSE